ncbi:MAG: ATP-binding cassette domain-containing protein [Phycisphaera sp.]|nr:ATP-binding cassette domain-containing protein [Phycisphaera sp.]
MPDERPLLEINDLAVSFPSPAGGRVGAVRGVSLSVYPKQTLAVVGESGCGKSVTALSVLQLIPTPPGKYEKGVITWRGQQSPEGVDLLRLNDKQMRSVRGNQIAMIFQEPMTSLNPVYTVGEQVMEAVLLHQKVTRKQAQMIAERALADVGIPDPAARLKEYPHRLSGGMRQRVMIAMALACEPELLLADEPTTALDVTIQAQILELLRSLQHKRNMAVILITHDLGVVAQNADVVAVMYAGRVVEYGSVETIFRGPMHPYTKGLFGSMPVLGSHRDRLATIPGNVPHPSEFPTGCAFHPRCDLTRHKAENASPDKTVRIAVRNANPDHRVMLDCTRDIPALREVKPGHWAACVFAEGYADAKPTTPDVAYRRPEPVTADE